VTMNRIKLPRKLNALKTPSRYKVFYGGRGSGKSWGVARFLIIQAWQQKRTILCTREYQKSIQDSVLRLLAEQINTMGLDDFFEVQRNAIHGRNGSYFIFEGLHHNVTKIKSMEGVDYAWVEEGEKVSNESWDVLIPTIRKPNSEIIITFNPDSPDDPTYQRFVKSPPENCITVKVNHSDNPWFPEVLREEMEYMKRVDYERYLHIWEGEPRTQTDAQVFKGKYSVEPFETPGNVNFYYGADFGFSTDPSTLIRCYIADRRLYIDQELWGLHIELDAMPKWYEQVPGSKDWPIEADSSRPDTISYIRRQGYKIRGVQKTKVEDGVEFLKSFERIVIHPRCKHTAEEFRMYSYHVDKLSNNITPKIEDKHNHLLDALRYSLVPVMRNQGAIKASDYNVASLGL
jgi:phage terminase large subunit